MEWAGLALVTAMLTLLAHHLGLIGRISEVVGEIFACSRCSTFWAVLGILFLTGAPLLTSAGIALACAYLSDWCGLLLTELAHIYETLWRKQRNRHRARLRGNTLTTRSRSLERVQNVKRDETRFN